MKEKPKSYKEINGTTRVGDFLRSIGKSDLLTKVFGSAAELITGDVKGAIEVFLKSSDELTKEQMEFSLKLLEADFKENEAISDRWQFDMQSDSWLSKNIRPLLLAYLTLMTTTYVILEASITTFIIKESWISLLETLLVASYMAYFGGRSFEKFTINKK